MRSNLIQALRAAAVLALSLCSPLAGAQAPLLSVDYETGTPDSGVAELTLSNASAADAEFVTADLRRYPSRFAIGHKVVLDDPAYVSDGAPRSEAASNRAANGTYRPGDHRRYTVSVLLKDWEDWNQVSAPLDIIWQFKHVSGGPDFSIGVKRNALVLRYGASGQVTLIDDIRPYDNRWIDLRMDVLWSRTSDGYFTADVRLDGETDYVRKADLRGLATFDPRFAGEFGYLKWGLYRADSRSANGDARIRVAYHDDIAAIALP
ncbi:heparin lyase I family protein [Lysobacter enzymogenes]|uniref:heparin lyase I family protein n=1 Tax=Lysobacter enzymogenes TaxID=69 RepID=UPI0019CFB8C2|nr:heparin lyase I family protein [Lysobacter enzymogenes]